MSGEHGKRLAIADPPYLGRARRWYGDGMSSGQLSREHGGRSRKRGIRPADEHADAAIWDDPRTHRELVERISREYDGFAIAMAHDNLRHYLQWLPSDIRIAVWVKSNALCGAARVINAWEPVAVLIPNGRRSSIGETLFPRDALNAPHPSTGFAGAKPRAWTRWVLDMLGYDQDNDTVDDIFRGSGAVSAEIAQLTL